jgi:hypothetical protein
MNYSLLNLNPFFILVDLFPGIAQFAFEKQGMVAVSTDRSWLLVFFPRPKIIVEENLVYCSYL